MLSLISAQNENGKSSLNSHTSVNKFNLYLYLQRMHFVSPIIYLTSIIFYWFTFTSIIWVILIFTNFTNSFSFIYFKMQAIIKLLCSAFYKYFQFCIFCILVNASTFNIISFTFRYYYLYI